MENNMAEINGHLIFIKSYEKKKSISLKENTINKNIVDLYRNDISTDPGIFVVEINSKSDENNINNSTLELKSGEIIQFNVELKDQFNHTIYDISKYYSDISVELLILNENEEKINNSYYITNNYNQFDKGNKYL